jgi:serine/arginine repetitive matrix protein 1
MASSVDAKLLKSTKFPPEFSQKVDMQKVNVEVMKKYVCVPKIRPTQMTNHTLLRRWIAGKISEILGSEDDVVIELCFNLLDGVRFVCLLLVLNCCTALTRA